ncbi:MAG: oleate hydratase [Flavonifractor plautii]
MWIYGLFTDKPGDYVKKPMRECTGKEICMEWLYHMRRARGADRGAGRAQRQHRAGLHDALHHRFLHAPAPLATGLASFPTGAVNFAFLGQFAETERDTIFTTEYSMRTGMEAVYTLLDIDRGVPEVWGSTYDVRGIRSTPPSSCGTAASSPSWS